MRRRLNDIYNNHKDHDITFNQSVIRSLGLKVDQIYLKIGDRKFPSILYSSSLTSSRIIIKLTPLQIEFFKKNRNNLAIKYCFKIPTEKSNIVFYVNSKIISLVPYGNQEQELYFATFEFINRAPNDLISILGTYIQDQENKHKRAEERFVLNNQNCNSLLRNSMENFLFISGKGRRCILTEISIFSAKIIIVGDKKEFKEKTSVLLLIKYNGLDGIGEMMGEITRVDNINTRKDLFTIIITFNQELIPPTYKMWIAEFLERVNIKAVL